MYRMPTEWEQDIAEIYVNEHRIIRPTTNIRTVLVSTLIFVLVTGILTWLLQFVLISVGVHTYLPSSIQEACIAHPIMTVVFICVLVIIIELFFCSKHIVVGLIKLYQHYAPEDMRRRCLFKPTCSEYAILAVQRYGTIIGLYKSYYHLVYLCKGNIYKIHYPWEDA